MATVEVQTSRWRAWAVNTDLFKRLSLKERERVRALLGAPPDKWTDEAKRYIEAGRRAFG